MNGVFVEDPQKKSARNYALEQTRFILEKVSRLQGEMRNLLGLLDYAVGGKMPVECCQRVISELSAAQSSLRYAVEEISALEPGEWVPEEAVKGGWR